MKSIFENQILSTAIVVSVLFHGLLLSVNFVSPKAFSFFSDEQKLDIVLVNTKQDRAPLKPDALAQANLDGGGQTKNGRTQSPLPDMSQHSDGTNLDTSRNKSSVSRQMQESLVSQLRLITTPKRSSPERLEASKPSRKQNVQSFNRLEDSRILARKAAELALNVRDKENIPKKTHISPSTKGVVYAQYYERFKARIQQIGELNFPRTNGTKLYGSLVIAIPIYHDGTIYEAEGGPVVERSSGKPALDAAAIRLVRQAAPYGRFPQNMRDEYADVWVLHSLFEFTRDDELEFR